jgi:hypothetical protein
MLFIKVHAFLDPRSEHQIYTVLKSHCMRKVIKKVVHKHCFLCLEYRWKCSLYVHQKMSLWWACVRAFQWHFASSILNISTLLSGGECRKRDAIIGAEEIFKTLDAVLLKCSHPLPSQWHIFTNVRAAFSPIWHF